MLSAIFRGLSLALLLGLTASCAASKPNAAAPRAQVGERTYRVPIDGSPVRGSCGAPVTLVMFGDFEDPRSIDVYRAVKALRTEYGEKVRLVFKHAPRAEHERGALAALFALAARAEKGDVAFWRVHDLLF